MFCSPSWMKTGRIRFAGEMDVSEMAPLMLGLRLFLLGLDGRSCDTVSPFEHCTAWVTPISKLHFRGGNNARQARKITPVAARLAFPEVHEPAE